MRQAIVTRYISPTNTRGTRISARADAGKVIVHWDHALNSEDNHKRAAMALALKFGWLGDTTGQRDIPVSRFDKVYVGGSLPRSSSKDAYVFVDKKGNS